MPAGQPASQAAIAPQKDWMRERERGECIGTEKEIYKLMQKRGEEKERLEGRAALTDERGLRMEWAQVNYSAANHGIYYGDDRPPMRRPNSSASFGSFDYDEQYFFLGRASSSPLPSHALLPSPPSCLCLATVKKLI